MLAIIFRNYDGKPQPKHYDWQDDDDDDIIGDEWKKE